MRHRGTVDPVTFRTDLEPYKRHEQRDDGEDCRAKSDMLVCESDVIDFVLERGKVVIISDGFLPEFGDKQPPGIVVN